MAARERTPLRAGYMGHLTEIANSLQTVAARRPPVASLLCSNTAWTDFAFGPLAERNQVPTPSPTFVLSSHPGLFLALVEFTRFSGLPGWWARIPGGSYAYLDGKEELGGRLTLKQECFGVCCDTVFMGWTCKLEWYAHGSYIPLQTS